jgi:UDP-GlcNAc:undecaprenyl-phosphate GlcNAc-1-phosphate transferase
MNNFGISALAVLTGGSFLITLAAILLLRPMALKIGLTDKPCSRKRHEGEIPLIGGLAIYLCIAFIVGTRSVVMPINTAFLTAVTVIIIAGVIDDFKGLDFRIRFAAEAVAALIVIKWGGIEITHLGNLLGFGDIQLGIFSTSFTVFAIVGGTNALNMMDGMDGLAGGTSFIVYLLIAILCMVYNANESLLFCYILAPATAAFLLFNFPSPRRNKASIFLGDAGSMILGFTLCVLIISASQGDHKIISPVTVLWLIAAPLLDTFAITTRRIRKRRSPFAPDREHIHHILPIAGYGKHATLFIILSFSLIAALLGLTLDLIFNVREWIMFYLFLVVFTIYKLALSYSWKKIKIARYLREHKNDRRKINSRRRFTLYPLPFADHRVVVERRSGMDRRYQVTEKDLRFLSKPYSESPCLNNNLRESSQ